MSFNEINNISDLNQYFSHEKASHSPQMAPSVEEVFNKYKELSDLEPEVQQASWDMLNKLEDMVQKENNPQPMMERIKTSARVLTDTETKEQTFKRLSSHFETNQPTPPVGLDKFNPKIPEEKQMLFDLAKSAAYAHPSPFGSLVHLFKFDQSDPDDRELLYYLLSVTSQNSPGGISPADFNNFGFNTADPEVQGRLIQIAQFALLMNQPSPISRFPFDMKNPEIRTQLLQFASQELERTSFPGFSIPQRYNLDPADPEDKTVIIDLLRKSATANGGRFVNFLEGSGFETDKSQLFDLFILASQNTSQALVDEHTPQNLGFDLSNPAERRMVVEIFKSYIKSLDVISLTDISLNNLPFSETDKEVREIRDFVTEMHALKLPESTANLLRINGADRQSRQEFAIKVAGKNMTSFIESNIPQILGFDTTVEEDRKSLLNIGKAILTQPYSGYGIDLSKLYRILGFAEEYPVNLARINELVDFVITEHPDYFENILSLFGTQFGSGDLNLIDNFMPDFEIAIELKEKFFSRLPNSTNEELQSFEFIKYYMDFQKQKIPMPFDSIPSAKAILENHLNIISKQDPFEREQNCRFLPILIYNAIKSGNPEQYFNELEKMKLLDAFRQLRNPELRFRLAALVKEENYPQNATSMTLLPLILVESFKESEFSDEQIKEITSLVNDLKKRLDGRNPFLKDNVKALSLIALLSDLKDNKELNPSEKVALLEKALTPPNAVKGLDRTSLLQSNCEAISAILALGGGPALRNLLKDTSINFSQILYNSFVNRMPQLANIPDLLDKFKLTFGQSRNPDAIFIYTASLSKLAKEETRDVALQNLSRYIQAVLEGRFSTDRLITSNNPHLQRLPEKLLEEWSKNITTNKIVGGTAEVETPLHIRLRETLENAAKQDHFAPTTIDVDSDPLLQQLLDPSATIAERTSRLNEFKGKLPANCPFIQTDLPLIERMLRAPNVTVFPPREYIFSNTDDPTDMLAMGTEVLGRCQNISGDPGLNRGLLGYMLNGQNRVLIMKESNDDPAATKITGRALIRLLLDDNGKPVMQLERIYPATLHSAQRKAMIEFAKEEAARLGVDIVSRQYGDPSTPYNQEILDYGGTADEYVDALGGQGIYRDFKLKNMPLL